jgi:hypothetical protein
MTGQRSPTSNPFHRERMSSKFLCLDPVSICPVRQIESETAWSGITMYQQQPDATESAMHLKTVTGMT